MCWWCGLRSGCQTCCSHWTRTTPCSASSWTCWPPCPRHSCGSGDSPAGPDTSPAPPASPLPAAHWVHHLEWNILYRVSIKNLSYRQIQYLNFNAISEYWIYLTWFYLFLALENFRFLLFQSADWYLDSRVWCHLAKLFQGLKIFCELVDMFSTLVNFF